jgi:hypothetical protein
MKTPEEALEEARRRAAAAQQGDRTDSSSLPGPGRATVIKRLAEWAIIEPDEAQVYSTRRFGGPITVFKRVLVRLLRQYFVQVTAQQSRFNAEVAAHVMRLEERVQALEQRSAPSTGTVAPETDSR